MKKLPFRKVRIIIFLLLAVSSPSFSQDILDSIFVQQSEQKSLLQHLSAVEKNNRVQFFYLEDWLIPFQMPDVRSKTSLRDLLLTLLNDTDVDFAVLDNYAVIFFKNPTAMKNRDALIKRNVEAKKSFESVSVGDEASYVPGKKITLRFTVRDSHSKITLPGTNVLMHELNKSFSSDAQGQFSVVLPAGEHMLTFRNLNYEEKLVQLRALGNGEVIIELKTEPIMLQEVVISDQNILTTGIGQTKIKLTELQRAPAFLGEADLIKSIQLQSGVSTASEASQGFNVRGGSADQNLILFDGVPVFNTSHALGFFTAFNSDALQESSFYKSSVPAEYGGRASSVLNITSKEGNFSKWHGRGGIGLVSSELMFDGPLKKDTSSLALSFRTSYSDWMLKTVKTRYKGISKGSIYFYDGNFKYVHKLSRNERLSLSGYTSSDRFSIATDTVNQWQNIAATVRYDRTVNDDWMYSASLHWGEYAYNVSEKEPGTAFDLDFGIIYPSLKIDVNRNGVNHKQTFGFQSTYYRLHPGTMKPADALSEIPFKKVATESAVESALYFSDSFNWNPSVHIEAGMRLSFYSRFGPGTVYTYESGQAREPENLIDSAHFSSGQFMKTYVRPEPRVAVNIVLDLQAALKIGYSRMHQYVHLISNSASITPVDIWQLSNQYFVPVRSDQFTVGYFRNSKSNKYEFGLEGYFKMQANILEFKDGANLILNKYLETALLNGKGRAYGVEVSGNKLTGRLTGGANYSYARSFRKAPSAFAQEAINRNDWFPSNVDQPHVFNANWRYNIGRRIFFTGVFTYHTGRPVSIPVASYSTDGNVIMDFPYRNNERLNDYHRLDVAFIIEGSNRKNRLWENNWLVSIYNVYGRKNPYSVFFVGQSGQLLRPYQLSLIGTPVPSLTYQFKF